MKFSKVDRARIARLRAAGLTVQEIGAAVGVSKQRVSQILATETVPEVGTRADVSIDKDTIKVRSDTETRILHSAIVHTLQKLGMTVTTSQGD